MRCGPVSGSSLPRAGGPRRPFRETLAEEFLPDGASVPAGYPTSAGETPSDQAMWRIADNALR
ncbi:hypothetical protein EBESD8_61030 [Rhodococcus aetherivorans]|nr:hypothetical protein EBESD8_61030 [Rhodococcus aetherivorans]